MLVLELVAFVATLKDMLENDKPVDNSFASQNTAWQSETANRQTLTCAVLTTNDDACIGLTDSSASDTQRTQSQV